MTMSSEAFVPDSLRGRPFNYRLSLLAGYLVVFGLFSSSLFFEFLNINDNTALLARERGNVLFRLVELTRDWNAQHGGFMCR